MSHLAANATFNTMFYYQLNILTFICDTKHIKL